MASDAHQRRVTPLARWTRLLLLLAWMFSMQGIGPGVVLVAALLDGDHAVRVGASPGGDLTVVLSHRAEAELMHPHQHDLVCSLIVAFAENPGGEEADHILSFRSVDAASRTLRDLSGETGMNLLKAPVFSVVWAPPVIGGGCRMTRHQQAPAWSPALELRVGTTIMRC